jgi:hypothetical protein
MDCIFLSFFLSFIGKYIPLVSGFSRGLDWLVGGRTSLITPLHGHSFPAAFPIMIVICWLLHSNKHLHKEYGASLRLHS